MSPAAVASARGIPRHSAKHGTDRNRRRILSEKPILTRFALSPLSRHRNSKSKTQRSYYCPHSWRLEATHHTQKRSKYPVLFDVGSERSFITKKIVQQLGIEATHKETLIVDGFGGTDVTHCTSARVKLKMRRTDGRLFTMFANSVPRLVSEIAIATLRRTRSRRNITLPTVILKPQILVGADYFHEIFRGSASTKLPSGFHLIRTCLDDMITGQGRSNRHGTSSKIKPANGYCCNVASAKDELEKFWSLELVGAEEKQKWSTSKYPTVTC
uniref:Peptidase aspartic putative domain-containing protein n=1 Tax=Parascaris univalens TaxID=6257 RepID=A0A915BZD1_PARUN